MILISVDPSPRSISIVTLLYVLHWPAVVVAIVLATATQF